jgi:hypothetical protein
MCILGGKRSNMATKCYTFSLLGGNRWILHIGSWVYVMEWHKLNFCVFCLFVLCIKVMFSRLMIAVVNSLWGFPQIHVSDRHLLQNPKTLTSCVSYPLFHFSFNFVVLSIKCMYVFLQLTNYHHHHNLSVFIPNLYDSLFHFPPFFSVPSKVLFLFMWLTQRREPRSGPWKMEAACFSNMSEQTYYPMWCNKPEDCHSGST